MMVEKVDILAFGAHPDDVELSCGGTLAKEIQSGKKVGIIDLTQGELGTRGNAELRSQEAQKAAEILGVSIRENLQFSDGFITISEPSIKKLITIIRKYQPNLVFCNAIDDRHPDHAIASELVSRSCFLSGLPKINTVYQDTPQEAWRPNKVYHYIQWNNLTPDIVVDITGFEEVKMQACLAYASQFYQSGSTENETPISSKNFLDSIRYRARDLGRLAGVEAAEGFTTEQTPLVDSLFLLQ